MPDPTVSTTNNLLQYKRHRVIHTVSPVKAVWSTGP
jgi:hypothetical protein